MLVSARKLNEMGVVDGELDQPKPVEDTVRRCLLPTSLSTVGPKLVVRSGAGREPKTNDVVGVLLRIEAQ